MTREQYLLLNNLVYRKEIYAKDPDGSYKYEGKTIEDLLNEKNLLSTSEQQAMSEEEWEEIYRLLREDEELKNVVLKDIQYDEDTDAKMICFQNPTTKEYVVDYAGTGKNEWRDNTVGGGEADSAQQKQALKWLNDLGFKDSDQVTVTGHSKGGNKAMYVTIKSDLVDDCYAFDGQGFSEEFVKKYAAEIEKRKGKINLIASYRDFVNILLYTLVTPTYINNDTGVSNPAEYHSPNSLFICGKDGTLKYQLAPECDQDDVMKFLHDFTVYFMDNATDGEKRILLSVAGEVASKLLSKDAEVRDDIVDQYGSSAAIIFAKYFTEFLDKYKKEHPIDSAKTVAALYKLLVDYLSILGIYGGELSTYILNLLSDARVSDCIIAVAGAFGYDVVTIRDFSEDTMNTILDVTKEVEDEPWWNFTKFDCWYRVEDLFGHLDLKYYANDVNTYYRKLIDINGASTTEIKDIFDKVYGIDSEVSNKLKTEQSTIIDLSTKIKNLADSISV